MQDKFLLQLKGEHHLCNQEVKQLIKRFLFHFHFIHCQILSVKGILSHSGSVFSFLELLLSFAELGQVEGSNLLSFLNLLLVGLDLGLELGGQVGHAVLVLSVLVILELELLDLALSSLVRLHVLPSLGLDIAKFNLELTDASLQLGQGGLATTHGSIIGVSKTILKFSKGSLKSSLALCQGGGVVLLRSELISKSGGINHGLLGLLFRVLGLVQEVINLSLHGVEGSFNTSLVSRRALASSTSPWRALARLSERLAFSDIS